jgi:hypothetical protein
MTLKSHGHARNRMRKLRRDWKSLSDIKFGRRLRRKLERRRVMPCPWPVRPVVRIIKGRELLDLYPGGIGAAYDAIQEDLRGAREIGPRSPGNIVWHMVDLGHGIRLGVTVRRLGRKFCGFKARAYYAKRVDDE